MKRIIICQKMIRGWLARRLVVKLIKEKKIADKKAKAEGKKKKK
jgi:hypothetical protein